LKPRRRILVALNTVVLQHELGKLLSTLEAAASCGADAVLVQDLGVYRLIRRHFPELELHGSTQLAVHNRAGAEMLRDLGFQRVVLARELTFEELGEIAALPGIETEVFIHGSLCYAYSGLCLLSAQTLSRSGNRGRCAYACRDLFRVSGAPKTLRDGSPTKRDPARGFPFSMKDLALPDFLPALMAAGVACFKIEGRKKSPLYVAATTRFYRDLLDRRLPDEERSAREEDLRTIFSRPWTRLFIQSHRDKEVADRDTVGHRGTRIGAVEALVTDERGDWLRFTSSRRLEVRDGIQVDLPRLSKPFGCAVDELRVVGAHREPHSRRTYETETGAGVEILLPDDHPDLPVGAPVYCSSSQEVKQRYRPARPKQGPARSLQNVDFEVIISPDEVLARAQARPNRTGAPLCKAQARVVGTFEAARTPEAQQAAVARAFARLGDTPLRRRGLTCHNPAGRFVPASILNQLRRDVAAALQEELQRERRAFLTELRATHLPATGSAPPALPASASACAWSLKVDRLAFLEAFDAADWEGLDELVVDIARDRAETLSGGLAELGEHLGREHIRLALPALTRKWEEAELRRKIERLKADGWRKWEAANLSAWRFLEAGDLDLATDWSLYCVNRVAALQLFELGATRVCLSPEDGIENVRSLLREFGSRATLIAYQDTPQFIAESCAYANLIGGCPGKTNCRFEELDLRSSYDEKLRAIDHHCRTILITREAFCLAPFLDELRSAGARSLRADFVYRRYEPGQVREVWRLLRMGKPVPDTYSARFEQGLL
jgi:putative protease